MRKIPDYPCSQYSATARFSPISPANTIVTLNDRQRPSQPGLHVTLPVAGEAPDKPLTASSQAIHPTPEHSLAKPIPTGQSPSQPDDSASYWH